MTAYPPIEYRLEFSDGQIIDATGYSVVGRNPGLKNVGDELDGSSEVTLVTLQDTSKSLSRTHLAIGQFEDVVWVSDLGSGNGTVLVYPNGSTHRLDSGTRYEVDPGCRVEAGAYFFTVHFS